MEEQADRPATLLSGGQQQRVALARAIAVNSRLLLMDEPLSNLDARLREEVRGKIRDLAKQLGSTVLYVTHDQIEAMAIADKIAIMQAGELLQVGTPAQIYHKPISADVADFFGSVNWLDGEIVAVGVADSPIGKLAVEAQRQAGAKGAPRLSPGESARPYRRQSNHRLRRPNRLEHFSRRSIYLLRRCQRPPAVWQEPNASR